MTVTGQYEVNFPVLRSARVVGHPPHQLCPRLVPDAWRTMTKDPNFTPALPRGTPRGLIFPGIPNPEVGSKHIIHINHRQRLFDFTQLA